MLPWASASGQSASFSDALFTSVSAACVTGLVVHDTFRIGRFRPGGNSNSDTDRRYGNCDHSGDDFSGLRKENRIHAEKYYADGYRGAPSGGGIVRLTGFVFKTTLIIELIGALILLPVFCRDQGIELGLWQSFFHSISAFCNAGFDLMGFRQPFSSLTSYSVQVTVNLTIAALILIGGLGFLTWDDIKEHKLRLRKYRAQSKMILATTAVTGHSSVFLFLVLRVR